MVYRRNVMVNGTHGFGITMEIYGATPARRVEESVWKAQNWPLLQYDPVKNEVSETGWIHVLSQNGKRGCSPIRR